MATAPPILPQLGHQPVDSHLAGVPHRLDGLDGIQPRGGADALELRIPYGANAILRRSPWCWLGLRDRLLRNAGPGLGWNLRKRDGSESRRWDRSGQNKQESSVGRTVHAGRPENQRRLYVASIAWPTFAGARSGAASRVPQLPEQVDLSSAQRARSHPFAPPASFLLPWAAQG